MSSKKYLPIIFVTLSYYRKEFWTNNDISDKYVTSRSLSWVKRKTVK